MGDLNQKQSEAVKFNGKHLLVLAGAGTGKTKTIIARAIELISSGVNPNNIQIVTFTKKAASEIVNRIKASVDDDSSKGLGGSTFHSWCNQLINKYPNVFGTSNFTIIDSDDQLSIMKMICGNKSLQYKKLRIKPQAFLDLYSFGRNTKRNLTESIKHKLLADKPENQVTELLPQIKADVEAILKNYEKKKRERKYLDYDDMIQLVANRLKKDAKAREVISKRYKYILVDEMQDTNPMQWELLNPFQANSHLFCVGDDAQSIYSFRGADFKNIHEFTSRVNDADVLRLEDNYRSTQEILDLSNWLLNASPLNYDKELKSNRGQGQKPILINVSDEWNEAQFVAETIVQNYTENNKQYSDHLVLSRSQNYTRSLQAVFIEKKIPFVTYGGRSFMEAAHIKDLFSAIRVVNNYQDEIAWVRFLTLWDGIGEITASKYINELLELDSIEACLEHLKRKKAESDFKLYLVLQAIYDNRTKIEDAVSKGYLTMKKRLASRYADDWKEKREGDFPVLEMLAKNYASLGEFITECILDNSTNINNSPTLKQSKIDRSENKDVVIISTIHSAKGLESDTCFVLNVSPRVFPSGWSIGDKDKVEEDRRVLYVALTRAKNHLYITRKDNSISAAKFLNEDGDEVESYFLNDLPLDLVEQQYYNQETGLSDDIDVANDLDFDFGMDFS